MREFPKFLKRLPELYGMGLPELVGLVLALNCALFFRLEGIWSASLCLSVISITKLFRGKIDFKALLLPRKKSLSIKDIYQGARS